MENGNFIKLNRQLLEWRYWYSETAVKLWILILMKANWKDGWFMGDRIPRGSLATSIASLADECGKSPTTIKKWLSRFEEDGQITRRVTNRYTQITVINYGFFQDLPERGVQRGDQQGDQQSDYQGDQRGDHNRRSKEREEIKKERRERAAPTLDEVKQFVKEEGLTIDPARFFNFYESQDWKTSSGYPIRDWKSKARSWQSSERPKRKEELPDFYNPEPIRDTEPKLATPEQIEKVKKQIQRGKQ